jgi:hypothetical protein
MFRALMVYHQGLNNCTKQSPKPFPFASVQFVSLCVLCVQRSVASFKLQGQ